MLLRTTLIALLSCSLVHSIAQERKVLIIGIDGTRQDALQMTVTPAIDEMVANATYTWDGLTQFPTYSGPGWSSMLTGVWSDKHGVTENGFLTSNFAEYPHLFDLVKTAQPDAFCASVCQWDPINDNIPQQADVQINTDTMQQSEDGAVEQMENPDLDVLFVHFDDVDITGHAFGYSVDVPEYVAAIATADEHVGNIIDAMQARPTFADEEWLVVLSTDHGGIDFGHGGASYEERNIFIIFSGNNFPNEELSTEYDTWESLESLALNLNQNDVYGTLDHDVYEFEEGEDFTIELKIKTNGWLGDPSIISDKDWWSGYNPGFVLACQTDENTWKFNLGDGDNRYDLEGGSINDGEWHHIAVSVDRDGQTFLFQDGEVVAATLQSLSGSIISGLPIGVGQDGTLDYDFDFDGWIDELRIWNVALTAETLEQWGCADLGVFHENYDDLIGYWKMEEIADIVIDGTDPQNQVDLALVNGPYISLEDPMTCQSVVTEAPMMVDIVPTALTHMCIAIEEAWDLDGQIVGINFDDCSNGIDEGDRPRVAIQPNPAHESFLLTSGVAELTSYEIYDVSGRKVHGNSFSRQQAIDVSDWTSGVYTVIVKGIGSTTLKLVVL